MEEALSCYQLPRPELVVSDVGTRIHDLRLQAVLVANATRTVREEALREATRNGTMDAIYCAAGNEFGNGNYSSGIIEGILHYRPEVRSWLKGQG